MDQNFQAKPNFKPTPNFKITPNFKPIPTSNSNFYLCPMPHLSFSFSAPYFTLHPPHPGTKYVWLVCHGYGQLAERFMRRFDVLDPALHHVVAVQGLSRFYTKPWEEVGASWMTREDRETDILNQHAYLDAVWETAVLPLGPHVQPVLMGFSQGVATVTRWLAARRIAYRGLMLWAGGLPSELESGSLTSAHPNPQVWLVAGKSDPLLEIGKVNEAKDRLEALAGPFAEVWFDGGHEVRREVIRELAERLG